MVTHDDLEPGSYRIATASGSLYLLEITATGVGSTLTRLPRERAMHPMLDGVSPIELRRDAEPLEVLGIIRLNVGNNGNFILDVRRDGAPTLRSTSPVLSIDRLSDEEAAV